MPFLTLQSKQVFPVENFYPLVGKLLLASLPWAVLSHHSWPLLILRKCTTPIKVTIKIKTQKQASNV